MNKKDVAKQAFAIGIIIFLTIVGLSGCVSNQNSNGNDNKFFGTWTGNKEISMFGGRGNNSISKLTFADTLVVVTLSSDRGTYSMNYSYTVNGNTLVLEPQFMSGGQFGRQPFNGSWQRNGTRPFNGTRPDNGSWPPNSTRPPFNNSQQPQGDGQRPSLSLSFNYSFNDRYDILYLDESQFVKG